MDNPFLAFCEKGLRILERLDLGVGKVDVTADGIEFLAVQRANVGSSHAHVEVLSDLALMEHLFDAAFASWVEVAPVLEGRRQAFSIGWTMRWDAPIVSVFFDEIEIIKLCLHQEDIGDVMLERMLCLGKVATAGMTQLYEIHVGPVVFSIHACDESDAVLRFGALKGWIDRWNETPSSLWEEMVVVPLKQRVGLRDSVLCKLRTM